jgi:hypothetical protein
MIERVWRPTRVAPHCGEVTACLPGRVTPLSVRSRTYSPVEQRHRGRRVGEKPHIHFGCPAGECVSAGWDRAQRSAAAAGVSDPWLSGSPDAANRKGNRARGQVPANRAPARTCWRRKTGRRSMMRSIIGRATGDVKLQWNSRQPGRTLSPRRLSERSRWSPRSARPSTRRERTSPKSPGTSAPNALPA